MKHHVASVVPQADRILHRIGSREKDRPLTSSGSSHVPKVELGLAESSLGSHVDRQHTNILTNCELVVLLAKIIPSTA